MFIFQSVSPKGIVELESCVVLPCDITMSNPFSFKITHPLRETFYFQCVSKEDQESWLRYANILVHFISNRSFTHSNHRDITRCIEGKSDERDFFAKSSVVPVTIKLDQNFGGNYNKIMLLFLKKSAKYRKYS